MRETSQVCSKKQLLVLLRNPLGLPSKCYISQNMANSIWPFSFRRNNKYYKQLVPQTFIIRQKIVHSKKMDQHISRLFVYIGEILIIPELNCSSYLEMGQYIEMRNRKIMLGYSRLKNSSITEKVIIVNWPEVWTWLGWMMSYLFTWISEKFRKICRIQFFWKSYNPMCMSVKNFWSVTDGKLVNIYELNSSKDL